jgi:hypothetical protein
MKKTTAALIMALGLALPAMTHGQEAEERRPEGRRESDRDDQPEGPRRGQVQRREQRRDEPRHERPKADRGERGDRAERPMHRDFGPGPLGGRPPIPPLFAALDHNRDGVIDEREIHHAAGALQMLDRNHDGRLTMLELRPPGTFGPHPDFRGENDRHMPGPRGGHIAPHHHGDEPGDGPKAGKRPRPQHHGDEDHDDGPKPPRDR